MYHSYSYYPPCMFDPAGVMVSDVSSICQRSKEAKGHDGMGVWSFTSAGRARARFQEPHTPPQTSHLQIVCSILTLYLICSIWEPQLRHWTLSSCIFLTYQSKSSRIEHILPKTCLCTAYTVPHTWFTHSLYAVIYATCLLPIDYILKEHLWIPI